jgi:DNA polymerase
VSDGLRAELVGLSRDLRAHLESQRLDGASEAEAPAPALPAPPNPIAPKTRSAPAGSVPVRRGPDVAAPSGPGDGSDQSPSMARVRAELGECERCDLHATRRSIVFGEGDPQAPVMFVGEGPGRDEDLQGRPFVGAAGRMLTNQIEKVLGLRREAVYIANVVKCRPPGNRDPAPIEVERCRPFLHRQLQVVAPRYVVALGRFSAHTLLETTESVGRLRGRLHALPGNEEVQVCVTYHPAYLLRNPSEKRKVFEDLLRVREGLQAVEGLELSPVGVAPS